MSPERNKSKAPEKGDGKSISIRLVKSGICTPKDQKATLRSLGLRRIGQTVVRPEGPASRGMVLKVRHLVEVVKG
jgi:large subunit ribosomal protein L30